jgi:hypothetical protein
MVSNQSTFFSPEFGWPPSELSIAPVWLVHGCWLHGLCYSAVWSCKESRYVTLALYPHGSPTWHREMDPFDPEIELKKIKQRRSHLTRACWRWEIRISSSLTHLNPLRHIKIIKHEIFRLKKQIHTARIRHTPLPFPKRTCMQNKRRTHRCCRTIAEDVLVNDLHPGLYVFITLFFILLVKDLVDSFVRSREGSAYGLEHRYERVEASDSLRGEPSESSNSSSSSLSGEINHNGDIILFHLCGFYSTTDFR